MAMDGETKTEINNTSAGVDYFHVLPEGCVAKILSFTSPLDVCRLSCVSSIFKSAGESDAVWERFLPIDYQSLISTSEFSSKKDIYLRLCDHPILIDQGKKSFSLDKRNGKKCYMLSARDLYIEWGDTPEYWEWVTKPESRFPDTAELIAVCWLELRGRIDTRMLSPKTNYSTYLVFKSAPHVYGFDYQPIDVSVGIVESSEPQTRVVYLDTESQRQECGSPDELDRDYIPNRYQILEERKNRDEDRPCTAVERRDGWLEVELGDFFNGDEKDEGELEISIMEVNAGHWKSGIVVEGIEIRPKQGD